MIDRNAIRAMQQLSARLEDDPAVKFAHAIEHGETPKGNGGFAGHVSLETVLGEI